MHYIHISAVERTGRSGLNETIVPQNLVLLSEWRPENQVKTRAFFWMGVIALNLDPACRADKIKPAYPRY